MTSSLTLTIREARALIEARRAAERSSSPGLDGLFTQQAIAEFTRWRAGGAVPASAGGLEILVVDLELDARV